MTVQETASWRNAVRSEVAQQPQRMDLRVRDASQAQARPVSFSRQLTQAMQRLADDPADFLISTAASMGTFMLVKSLAMAALPLATPIVAGMIAAALITAVRATSQEAQNRDRRVAALYADPNNPPGPQELAQASQVNMSGVVNAATKHGLFSGLIGSLLGFVAMEGLPELGEDAGQATTTTMTETTNVLIEERTGYTVIKVENPGEVLLNKDAVSADTTAGSDYIDSFAEDKLIINGPLFDKPPNYGETMGAYILNGEMHGDGLTDPDDPKFIQPNGVLENFADNNGIMGQKTDGSMFLMTYDEWQEAPLAEGDVKWAFQNGPILLDQHNDYGGVEGNHNPHDPNTAKKAIERTAMGYNEEGDLLIIHSTDPTNFHMLSNYMEREGAVDAMFLDGTNVGYIKDGVMHGKILDGSTTFHIQGNGGGRTM